MHFNYIYFIQYTESYLPKLFTHGLFFTTPLLVDFPNL